MQDHGVGGTSVNFIAFDEARPPCLMVLVEGPWTAATEDHLRSLQARMYGCLDAALDGQLAAQFPDETGKPLVVRVECYDLPRDNENHFISCFAAGVSALPNYATEGSPFVGGFRFEVSHDTLGS